jgi:hypothetical protein
MTHLEEIEAKIYNKHITFLQHKYNTIKACSIKMDNNYAIFFNPKSFDDNKDMNTALSHEYYHCEFDCLYNVNDNIRTKKRREFKANYEMACELVPPQALKVFIESGKELWEISDFFYLTEDFIMEAFRIYKSKGLI